MEKTEHKFTDKEIKEALELCASDSYTCDECLYLGKGSCRQLTKDAIDLISRYEAELKKRDADIEGLLFAVQSLSGHLSSAKAEAIKEFENLIVNNLIEQAYSRDYLLCIIKEWAKEMMEAQK